MNFVDEQRFAFAICILCDMNINQKKAKYKTKASLDQGLVALLSIKQWIGINMTYLADYSEFSAKFTFSCITPALD